MCEDVQVCQDLSKSGLVYLTYEDNQVCRDLSMSGQVCQKCEDVQVCRDLSMSGQVYQKCENGQVYLKCENGHSQSFRSDECCEFHLDRCMQMLKPLVLKFALLLET
jgi:hypothetical protein